MKRFLCFLLGTLLLSTLVSCGDPTATTPLETMPSPVVTTTVSTPAATSTANPDVVVFSDPVLEKAVRDAMGRPEGDITLEDAQSVTELRMDEEWNPEAPAETRIQNIDALEYFTNLERLEMQFHAITDLSPLAGLTKLHSLGVGGNQIRDISVLSHLKEMRFLSIFTVRQQITVLCKSWSICKLCSFPIRLSRI